VETQSRKCPNCSAPLNVPVGETDVLCDFCESKLRFVPGAEELEVVRTREEMKRKERVEVQKAILEKQLKQEEAAKWRQAAAHVAVNAIPLVGQGIGRGLFNAALGRRGCLPCGCLIPLLGAVGLFLSWLLLVPK
jgi:hypothetical protein